MKVLHAIPSLDAQRGIQAALLGTAPAQVAAGLDVTIVHMWRHGADRSLEASLRRAGVKLVGFGPATGPLLRHPEMAASIRSLVPVADIVHIHSLWEEIQHQAAVECRLIGTPYLVTPHGMLTPWSLRQSRLKKQIYLAWRLRRNLRHAAAIHCASPMEANAVKSYGIGPPVFVEPFGIDLEQFQSLPERGLFRQKYGITPAAPLVTFLGRIHPGKGVEHLIPAMAEMKLRDAWLAIVGPDSDGFQAKMDALARKLGIHGRVVFTGMLNGSEKLSALVDCDTFALPSDHENFGMVVVEALAAGCAVIISDHVGIAMELKEAGVARVCDVNAQNLARELDDCLGNPDRRHEMSHIGRAFVQSRYDQRQVAERWVRHYAQIVNRQRL